VDAVDPGAHLIFESPARELGFDDNLCSCLCILDVEIEQPEVQIAGFIPSTQDGSSRRVNASLCR
jgi:hypothetical protein